MGKPLITTNVPGCREVVDDGENGFLCEVRNAKSLANAIQKFINIAPSRREAMGQNSRKKAEAQFDEKLVIDAYLTEIDEILSS